MGMGMGMGMGISTNIQLNGVSPDSSAILLEYRMMSDAIVGTNTNILQEREDYIVALLGIIVEIAIPSSSECVNMIKYRSRCQFNLKDHMSSYRYSIYLTKCVQRI
jgi:hypothetical protein